MATEDQFDQRTRALLSRLSSAFHETALASAFGSTRLSDVLVKCKIENTHETDQYDDAISEAIRYLTHIPANPSRKKLSQLVVDSYVFTGSKDSGQVNSSEAAAAKFLARIVARAKQHKSVWSPDQPTARNGSTFILKGDRGAGKTFFLNYLISRFHRVLNSVKCIFIRVSLTKNIGLDGDLRKWFYVQAAKVLLKYYDPQSTTYNPENPTIPALKWLTNSTDADDHPAVVALKTAFMEGIDTPVSNALSQVLCEKVFHFAESSGFSFVCMIDGFDRLGRDEDAVDRFRTLKASVQLLLSSPSPIGAVFVIGMRNTTYASLQHRFQAYGAERRYEIKTVGAAPSLLVVQTRLTAIRVQSASERFLGNNDDITARIRTLMSRFTERYLSPERTSELNRYIPSAAPNLRAVMQSLACVFFAFSTNQIASGYRAIEQLIKARMRFPPLGYSIHGERSSITIRLTEFARTQRYDGVFAPLIFRLTHVNNWRKEVETKDAQPTRSIVLQLRVLWHLKSAGKEVFLDIFCDGLSKSYGYDSPLIAAALDILESYQCVKSIDHIDDNDQEVVADRRIAITHHGTALLQTYCFDPAYLHLSLLRVPLAARALQSRFVQIAALSVGPSDKHSLIAIGTRHWIEAKIVNALFMMSLISASLETTSRTNHTLIQGERRLQEHVAEKRAEVLDACVRIALGSDLANSEVNDILDSIARIADSAESYRTTGD